MTTSKRVALVSTQEAFDLDTDLPHLVRALASLGMESTVVAWDDPNVGWGKFDLAVVRSTWNYVAHRRAFVTWSRSLPCPLKNDADVIAWNTDKTYLRALQKKGIAIVPTTWIDPGDEVGLPECEEWVIKPSISAGAKDTGRYRREHESEARAHVARLVAAGRTVMVQPYVRSVDARGETGMLYFGGQSSHAIHKGPILSKAGPTKQEGLFEPENIQKREASSDERDLAEQVLASLPFPTPLYARVDVVLDEHAKPQLLELELTEPSVFLDLDARAADRFARAIAAELE